MRILPGSGAHAGPTGVVGGHPFDGIGQRTRIVGRNQYTGDIGVEHLPTPGNVCGHHGDTQRLGLHQRTGATFSMRWQHHHMGRPVLGKHVGDVSVPLHHTLLLPPLYFGGADGTGIAIIEGTHQHHFDRGAPKLKYSRRFHQINHPFTGDEAPHIEDAHGT